MTSGLSNATLRLPANSTSDNAPVSLEKRVHLQSIHIAREPALIGLRVAAAFRGRPPLNSERAAISMTKAACVISDFVPPIAVADMVSG